MADYGRRFPGQRVIIPGAARPVLGALEGADDGAVVVGCADDDGIGCNHGFLVVPHLDGEHIVEVAVVEWKIADGHFGEFEVGCGSRLDVRVVGLVVDGLVGEALDEHADVVLRHVFPILVDGYLDWLGPFSSEE